MTLKVGESFARVSQTPPSQARESNVAGSQKASPSRVIFVSS